MKKIILLCIICLFTCATYSQTTIGSDNEPVQGALLDLKQNTSVLENSVKGMVLPRVNLVNLKPAATGANNFPASIGSPASESWDLEDHIGLMVYNVYRCPAGRTVYNEIGPQVWDGSRWELLTKPTLAEATPAETSGVNTWGKSVVRHLAKPNPDYVAGTDPDYLKNIYEEFYSADFGPAGRWMTTNLTARKYDGIKHSQSDGDNTNGETERTLTGPTLTLSGNSGNTAYWCYPGKDTATGGTSSTDYDANPFMGLLYTWDASTAGKGEANGQGNAQGEGGRPYGTSTLNGITMTVNRIQGICPQGWHFPSDYEWTELENEIIRNTVSYANVAGNIDPGNNSALLPQENISRWRGSTHGTAMKDPCKLSNAVAPEPDGLSKSVSEGGFSALPAGQGYQNAMFQYGENAAFATSSSGSAQTFWVRETSVSQNPGKVLHNAGDRARMFSVRCVKD